MSFYLSGRPEDSCRLKSFSSRSQGGKVPISIVVEAADGARQTIELKAHARPLNAPSGGQQMQHGKH